MNTVMPALADLFGLRNSTEASARSGVTCTEDKKLVKLAENFGFPFPLPPSRYLIKFGAEKTVFSMPLCSTPVVPLASYFAFIFLCWHFSTSVDKIFLLFYRDAAKLWREAVSN